MVSSVSTTPSYYSLLNPSSSGSKTGSSVLDAVSSAIDAATIADGATDDTNEVVNLSPTVVNLLNQLNGGGTGIPGALIGGTSSSSNLILKAASKAAMKQAYASIAEMAYNAASIKRSADSIAANPMDSVISAYRKALSGAAPVTTPTTTEA